MTNGSCVYNRGEKMVCHCIKWCSWDCSARNPQSQRYISILTCVHCLSNDLCICVNYKTKSCMLVLHQFSTEVWDCLWNNRGGGSAASAAVLIWTGMAEIYSRCLQVWCLFCDVWQVNISQLDSIHQLAQFPGLCCGKSKIQRL